MTSEKNYSSWYFLLVVVILYVVLSFFYVDKVVSSLLKTLNIFIKIIPTILFILVFMAFMIFYLKQKFILKHLGKDSGVKGWFISIVSGMLSSGPIYLWLPLLNELQKKGVRNAFLATFLYSRAIKIPLLPMLIVYLGFTYTIILTVFMILASLIQGVITEKMIEVYL